MAWAVAISSAPILTTWAGLIAEEKTQPNVCKSAPNMTMDGTTYLKGIFIYEGTLYTVMCHIFEQFDRRLEMFFFPAFWPAQISHNWSTLDCPRHCPPSIKLRKNMALHGISVEA